MNTTGYRKFAALPVTNLDSEARLLAYCEEHHVHVKRTHHPGRGEYWYFAPEQDYCFARSAAEAIRAQEPLP